MTIRVPAFLECAGKAQRRRRFGNWTATILRPIPRNPWLRPAKASDNIGFT